MTVSDTPCVQSVRCIPVAGHDGMLLNLSGAHAPFFTRNLVLVVDSAGRTGIGEVPGGVAIGQVVTDAGALLAGRSIGELRQLLGEVERRFADRDAGGRGALHERFPEARITLDPNGALVAGRIDPPDARPARGAGLRRRPLRRRRRRDPRADRGIQALLPGWRFDPKRPCLVR